MLAPIAITMAGVMPVRQCSDVLTFDQTRLQFANRKLVAFGNPREVEHRRSYFFTRNAPVTVGNGYKFRDRRSVGHTPKRNTVFGCQLSVFSQRAGRKEKTARTDDAHFDSQAALSGVLSLSSYAGGMP